MRAAILHQGFVPHYRVRFFEQLAETSDVDYVVYHGSPPPGLGHEAALGPFAFPNVSVPSRFLRIPSLGTLTYQSAIRSVERGGFDAVILGTHLQFISNHLLFATSRLRGRAVLYWGHGNEKVLDMADDATLSGSLRERLRASVARIGVLLKYRAARLPDGYLVYTEGGAKTLRSNGVATEAITVVRNTLDMKEQQQLHTALEAVDESELRRELGLRPDSVVFICVGRIYAAKRVGDLVEAVKRLNDIPNVCPFEVVIIGDGPDADTVRKNAAGVENVTFTGSIYDQARIARYFRVASGLVAPGVIGLVANHALAHGLPVINQATDAHSPEMEYLTVGADTVIAPDMEEFVATLAELINSPERLEAMASAAADAGGRLSLDVMVDSFDRGVRAAIARRRSGTR